MATPIIQKTGTVSGPSAAGQGSNDLVPGETVNLANLEPTHSGEIHNWEFADSPIDTTPVLLNPTTETPSFVVDPDAKLAGSYEIKCTVNGLEFSTEIFAKPLTNSGGRIPAHKEQEQYDEAGNPKGWHEAETVFKRSVDELLGQAQASITERGAGIVIPQGNSSTEVKLGGVVYPGSVIAIAGFLDESVTGGSIALNLKVNGVVKLTASLTTGSPSFASLLENPGDFPILSSDEITVEIVGTSYVNAGAIPSGLAVTVALSSNLSNAPLTIPDASNVGKGITRLSVAAVLPATPIAVGDNDGRVPSQNENDALQGTSGVPADANRYVTNADPRNTDSRAPTAHSHANAIHSDVAAEISPLTDKAVPVAGDHLLIEDSAALNVKKRIAIGSLPSGAPTNPLIIATGDGVSVGAAEASIVSGDTFQSAGVAQVSSPDQGFCSGTAICSIVGGSAEVTNGSTGGFAAGWSVNGTGAGSASIRTFGTAGFAMGWAYNRGVGGQAEVTSDGNAAFALGYAYCGASGIGFAKVYANGYGAFAQGASRVSGTARARLMALGEGSHAQGRVFCEGTSIGYIRAHSDGSHAGGMVRGRTSGTGYIRAGYGCFVHGYVYGNGDSSHIYVYGHGSWAGGFANAGGQIIVYNDGAFAFGHSEGTGRIIARTEGNVAMGVTFANDIYANGFGSFVHGWANTGDIEAAGSNSQQFGPGLNSENDTMKIGVAGIRFKGTDGAPGVPVNGDFWMQGVNAFLHKGGISGRIATLDTPQQFTKSQRSAIVVLTDVPAGNVSYTATDSNIFNLVATSSGSRTLNAPIGMQPGMTWQVWFQQDAINGLEALLFAAFYDWGDEGAPDFSAQLANVKNIITCVALSGGQIAATALKGFA